MVTDISCTVIEILVNGGWLYVRSMWIINFGTQWWLGGWSKARIWEYLKTGFTVFCILLGDSAIRF